MYRRDSLPVHRSVSRKSSPGVVMRQVIGGLERWAGGRAGRETERVRRAAIDGGCSGDEAACLPRAADAARAPRSLALSPLPLPSRPALARAHTDAEMLVPERSGASAE